MELPILRSAVADLAAKKTGCPETGHPVGEMKRTLVTTAAFLVCGIAEESACCTTRGCADHRTLACAARLMADDGTDTRAE
jgi:hypothetical protein